MLRAEVFYRALPWMALLLKIRQVDPQQYQQFTNDLNLKPSSCLSVVLVYGLTLMAALSAIWPSFFWIVGILSLMLLAVNWSVYQFFYRKRGAFFTCKVLPWHWLYYFYSGLAFVIGDTAPSSKPAIAPSQLNHALKRLQQQSPND